MDTLTLNIPNSTRVIRPGNLVKLGRFDSQTWTVHYGWYSWGGNRPVCGWYLEQPGCIKPLQLPDLDDIYLIKM